MPITIDEFMDEAAPEAPAGKRPMTIDDFMAEPKPEAEPEPTAFGQFFPIERAERPGAWGINQQLDGLFSGRLNLNDIAPFDITHEYGRLVGMEDAKNLEDRIKGSILYSVAFDMDPKIAFDNIDSLNKHIFGKELSPTAAWRNAEDKYKEFKDKWSVIYGLLKKTPLLQLYAPPLLDIGTPENAAAFYKGVKNLQMGTVESILGKTKFLGEFLAGQDVFKYIADPIDQWTLEKGKKLTEWSDFMMTGLDEYYRRHPEDLMEMNPGIGAVQTVKQFITRPELLIQGTVGSMGLMMEAFVGNMLGGPAGGVTMMAQDVFGRVYAQARKEGTKPGPAFGQALFTAIPEAYIEQWTFGKKLAFAKNFNKIVADGWPKVVWETTKAFFRGSAEEGSQQLNQNFWRWVFTDRSQIWTENVGESAGAGGPIETLMFVGFGGAGSATGPAVSIEQQNERLDMIQEIVEQVPDENARREMTAEIEQARKDVAKGIHITWDDVSQERKQQLERVKGKTKKEIRAGGEKTQAALDELDEQAQQHLKAIAEEGDAARRRIENEELRIEKKPTEAAEAAGEGVVIAYRGVRDSEKRFEGEHYSEDKSFAEKFGKVEKHKIDTSNVLDLTNIDNIETLFGRDIANSFESGDFWQSITDKEGFTSKPIDKVIDYAKEKGYTGIKYVENFSKDIKPTNYLMFFAQPTEQGGAKAPAAPERGKPERVKELQRQIEEREAGATDEQLSGITKKRRRSLIKETAKKIQGHDIYQTESAAIDEKGLKVGTRVYFIEQSGKGEFDAVLENFPPNIQRKIKKQFTFERSEVKSGRATAWDTAVQERFGTEAEQQATMDLSEFIQTVADSIAESAEKGALNTAAFERFAQSGFPEAEMLAEKYRMLQRGFSDIEINNMITDWAERNDVPAEVIADELINPEKFETLFNMPEEAREAEIERIATEQILIEDQIAAQNAARQILEANDITDVEIEPVEEIREEDYRQRRKSFVERDIFGRETVAPMAGKQADLGIGKGTKGRSQYKPELVKAITRAFNTIPIGETTPSNPAEMLKYLKEQAGWEDLFNNYVKPQAEIEGAWDEAVSGREFSFYRGGKKIYGAAFTAGEKQIIHLALGADIETGFHEGWHILRTRLTDNDIATLMVHYGPGRVGEEAEAAAFARYAKGQSAPNSTIRRIFEKIMQIIEKIRSALAGRGLRTPADIFGEAIKGKVPKTAMATAVGARFEEIEQIETTNFKRWFNNSKVVDENGKPKIVYHGSHKAFLQFDKFDLKEVNPYQQAFFFAEKPTVAAGYAQAEGSAIYPVYLSLQNPMKIDYAKTHGYTRYETPNMDKIVKEAKSKGHDGLIISNIRDLSSIKDLGYSEIDTQYIAFEPTQIKSVYNKGTFNPNDERIMFETRPVGPVFYSKLQRAVVDKMPNKMDASAFGNWAKKQGIKDEEMLWLGVDELIAKGGAVTKQQVLDTIAANDIQLEEVVKGGKAEKGIRDLHLVNEDLRILDREQERQTTLLFNEIDDLPQNKKDDIKDFIAGLVGLSGPQVLRRAARYSFGGPMIKQAESNTIRIRLQRDLPGWDWTNTELLSKRYYRLEDEQAELRRGGGNQRQPKFETYTLPGGTNYREVLMRLPVKSEHGGYHIRWPDGSLREWTENKESAEKRAKEVGGTVVEGNRRITTPIQEQYQSPHWSETNVLAHFRLTDRTDKAGKKVLFIEEIQSDWHQKGRELGYKQEKTGLSSWEYLRARGIDATGWSQERAALEARELGWGKGVPNAPFKTTWPELAFKRVLRMAAEEGYEKVAWTTGEQQAERYPSQMRKVVDNIKWDKGTFGKNVVNVFLSKNGKEVGTLIIDRKTGNVAETVGLPNNIRGSTLSEVVGGKMADQILKQETGEISGEDFVVGDKGMWIFYDQILPSFAKKYTKKFGVKDVGEAEIFIDENKSIPDEYYPAGFEAVHAIPVTDEMAESVMGGQVMFETSGERFRREAEQRARINARKARLKEQLARQPKKQAKAKRGRIKINIREVTPGLREDLQEAARAERTKEVLKKGRNLKIPIKEATPELIPGATAAEEVPGGRYVYPEPPPGKGGPPKKVIFDENFYENNRRRYKDSFKDKVSKAVESVMLGFDRSARAMSTRLEKIAPELKYAVRRYVFDVQTRTVALVKDATPMIKAWKKFEKNDRRDFKMAALNGDAEKINALVEKYNVRQQYEDYRAVMDEIFEAGNSVGLEILYDAEHWPRVVKDFKGLIKYLQTTDKWSPIQQAIFKRQEQAGGRALTDAEQAQVINTLLRGFKIGGVSLSRPGAARERTIEVFTSEIENYYYELDEGIQIYIQNMMQSVGAREFFGKETNQIRDLRAQKARLATRLYKTTTRIGYKKPILEEKHEEHISKAREKFEDVSKKLSQFKTQTVEDSIGYEVLNLYLAGKISYEQQGEIAEMFKAIFEPRGMHGAVRQFTKLAYIDVLANPEVAMTQLEEIGLSFYRSKAKSAPAVVRAFTGRSRIKLADIGVDDINQYMQDLGFSELGDKLLFMMQTTDLRAKEAYVNTAVEDYTSKAKKPDDAFKKKMKQIFGAEAEQVIEDLKNGTVSDNVKFLAFSELADMQPIAITETPQYYARGGNHRIWYMLRSFTLRRLDVLLQKTRKAMVNPAKNPVQFITASIDLAQYLAILTAFGVGKDVLRAWFHGQPFGEDEFLDSVIDNLLQFVLLSRWTAMRTKKEGLGSAIGQELMPPTKAIDAVINDVRKGKLEKTIRSIPEIGEPYYWWFGGGAGKSSGRKKKFVR